MKMTDEDVLRLADEAGTFVSVSDAVFALDAMNRFAQQCYAQGALDMRERCAKACEAIEPLQDYDIDASGVATNCARAIRALTVGET